MLQRFDPRLSASAFLAGSALFRSWRTLRSPNAGTRAHLHLPPALCPRNFVWPTRPDFLGCVLFRSKVSIAPRDSVNRVSLFSNSISLTQSRIFPPPPPGLLPGRQFRKASGYSSSPGFLIFFFQRPKLVPLSFTSLDNCSIPSPPLFQPATSLLLLSVMEPPAFTSWTARKPLFLSPPQGRSFVMTTSLRSQGFTPPTLSPPFQ